MPDVPIVGTATVGAPGATRKPTLLITGQPLFHLSYRCNLWSRQRDFNLQPPPYRGDALALSYAGSSSVVQILPPLHFVNSRLPHECARGKDRHSAGLTKQFHSSLYWRSISLSRIARTARSNKVSQLLSPPRARGITCSSSSSPLSNFAPQYWHVCPSRMRIFFLDRVWIRMGNRRY